MRKTLVLVLTFVLAFAMTACSVPFFGKEDTTEPPERTYVITTQGLIGLFKMADSIRWRDTSVCALQYIGNRETYEKKLNTMYKNRFSQIDRDTFDTLKRVDMGGDDVYLVVPHYDMIAVCAFGIKYNPVEEKPQLLKQYTDQTMPFVMICDAQAETMNCQIVIYIQSTGQVFKLIPQRSMKPDEYPLGFQTIEQG